MALLDYFYFSCMLKPSTRSLMVVRMRASILFLWISHSNHRSASQCRSLRLAQIQNQASTSWGPPSGTHTSAPKHAFIPHTLFALYRHISHLRRSAYLTHLFHCPLRANYQLPTPTILLEFAKLPIIKAKRLQLLPRLIGAQIDLPTPSPISPDLPRTRRRR